MTDRQITPEVSARLLKVHMDGAARAPRLGHDDDTWRGPNRMLGTVLLIAFFVGLAMLYMLPAFWRAVS